MADVKIDPTCKNADTLLTQGIRAYALGDYRNAVEIFTIAGELKKEELKDDFHPDMAELYVFYSKSLLGLSRQRNDAFGTSALVEESEDEEEEEDENEDGNKDEEEAENGKETEKADETKEEEKTESVVAETENGVESKNKVEEKPENVVKDDKKEEKDSKDEEKSEHKDTAKDDAEEDECDDDDDDCSEEDGENKDGKKRRAPPSDLQIAWEVMELAKMIYENQKRHKEVIDCLTTLGEISIENDKFPAALNDLAAAAENLETHFPANYRKKAEVFYSMGLAYSLNGDLDECQDCYKKAMANLEEKIAELEKQEGGEDKEEEMAEIRSLMPELQEKIDDIAGCKKEAIKTLVEMTKEPEKASKIIEEAGSSSSSGSLAKPATNISHLVKRKRKPEEEDSENPAKKEKSADVV